MSNEKTKNNKVNKVEIGNKFRDDVASLLHAGGYNFKTELLIGHKKVDIYFEEKRFGKLRKYAIEAKNYQRPLEHSDLEKIYGGYSSLVKNNQIDEIIIISANPIKSAAANAYIQQMPEISHQTFNEFQESILGFHQYLSNLVNRHKEDGLEDYFISPSMINGDNLEDHINKLIEDEDVNPIAVISGYGMGKTSFSRHIAYSYAQKFLAGENSRIPVLVSLGRISREQGLEGLIGTTLTSESPSVRDYSFPIFDKLNKMGRFLIILDGFDEMKHMMTGGEFRSTFDELNRLVKGKSKVILLGRPTAFLSENEQAYVLRGTRRIGNQMHQTPGAPRYTEVKLSPFSMEKIRVFIESYMMHLMRTNKVGGIDDSIISKRKSELKEMDNDGIMSRPVHARMLADLATDPEFEISHLTRHQLYDHFVDHLIDREINKIGRGSTLKHQDRRSFACDIAWHLWNVSTSSNSGCRMEDLPERIFSPYASDEEDSNTLRRALLSGSFLDEKSGGVFYFSHRSFQEFLVAEYIWSNLSENHESNGDILKSFRSALTKEVFDFLIERDDRQFFRALLSSLSKCKVPMSPENIIILIKSSIMREIAASKSASFITEWDVSIFLFHDLINRKNDEDAVKVCKTVGERCQQKPDVIKRTIIVAMIAFIETNVPWDFVGPCLIAMLFSRSDKDLDSLSYNIRRSSRHDGLGDVIFNTVTAANNKKTGELMMTLDINGLINETNGETFVTNVVFGDIDDGKYTASFDEFFKNIDQKSLPILKSFYKKDAIAGEINDENE